MSNLLPGSIHHLAKITVIAIIAAFLLGLVALNAWATPIYAGEQGSRGAEEHIISPAPLPLRSPAPLPLVAPSLITATKTYTLATDSDGDTQADPGDTLTYTIVISNNGSLATGLVFSDTLDPNTNLSGLVSVSPVAIDDSYNAITNPVTLNVPDGISDTFANDYPGLNPAVTGLTSFGGGSLPGNAATNAAGSTVNFGTGGSLTVNANGSFDFTPAVGFQGVFTFFYRLQNFVGPADGLVSLIVDAAPTIISTIPTNGATNVNGASNITLNFSENVAIAAGGVTLDCGAGPVSFTATPALPASGVNSLVLDPTSNLPGNATCTVTILAANVTDSDLNDPPNNLDGNGDGVEGDNYVLTFDIAPAANDDSFGVTPHLTLNSSGTTTATVRANDDPTNVTITGFGPTLATANGTVPNGTNSVTTTLTGTVILNTDGTFTYFPPPDTKNTNDAFFYTITGGDTATVTLTIQNQNLIWFVDASAAAGGNGTQARPFNLLTGAGSFDAVASDNAGDFIFIADGNYTCGLTLLNTQTVVGDGSSSTLSSLSGVTPVSGSSLPAFSGADPLLSTSGSNCLTLGSDNTIRGLTIGNTPATRSDLTGTNFGTLTVLETTLNGTGRALNLDTGTLNATFDGVTSTSGANNVNLISVGGTANLGSGTLSGSTGTAFNVSGGNATVTYAGNLTQNNAQRVVDVQNTTGGAINFTTGTVTGGASSTGINIDDANGNVSFANLTLGTFGSRMTNQAVTINRGTGTYSLGNVSIFTNNAQGIVATNADGIINSTSGTVDAGQATAININGPAGLTTLGMTLTRVDSSGGSATGIIIQDTNGSFIVNGDGVNTTRGGNSSGGVISGKSGADGSTTTGIGVYLSNASGVTLRRMTINGTNQNHGIRGVNSSNFTLEYSTVSGTNGDSAALDEGSVNFDNLTGSAAITGCIIEGGFEDNLNVVNTSGTLDRLVITDCTFGFNNIANGNNNILLESFNPGTVFRYTLQSSLIKGARADWINPQPSSGGTMDAIIGGSTPALGNSFDNTGANAHPGAVANGNRILLQANGTSTFNISNNTIKGSLGAAIATNSGTGTAVMSGRIEDNDIGVAGTPNSGSTGASGISIQSTGGGDVTVLIDGNDIRQYNNHGILFTLGDEMTGTAIINATVSNNTVNTPGTILDNFNGFHLNNGTVGATDDFTTCLNVFDNNFTGGGKGSVFPNNADVRLQQRQSTTVQLPGYTGPSEDTSDGLVDQVVTYLRPAGSGGVKNNLFGTGAANTPLSGSGGGFVNSPGGAACTQP